MTDQKELEKLFKQYYRQMYRLATMLLHDDAESKDVVHDIFANLLRNSQDLREDTAESYLLTSVQNRSGNGSLIYLIYRRPPLFLEAPCLIAETGCTFEKSGGLLLSRIALQYHRRKRA